jgi:signal transduction histidine kinase
MMTTSLDWPRVCSLLAHELRSPSAVIAGYARMLGEGRLTGDDQAQAYAQIERAASRISSISRQASDLSRWLAPATDGATPLLCSALMTDAITHSGATARVTVNGATESPALWVMSFDRHALAAALGSAIEAVCRESPDGPIGLCPRVDTTSHSCDILIGPSPALASMASDTTGPSPTPWSADRGGMGLALVLCAAVVTAHGGELQMLNGRRDLLSIRLPLQAEAA